MRRCNGVLCALALASILILDGCQTAPRTEQKKDVSADTAAVSALRGKFSTAFNSNDAAALAALYADDAIVMLANQPVVEGKQAIQASYDAMFKANAAKIVITPLETNVAGDWAYDRGNVTTTITPKSGKPSERSSRYIVIVKRQPGNMWQLYRMIDNSNNPPAAATKKAAKKVVKKGSKSRR